MHTALRIAVSLVVLIAASSAGPVYAQKAAPDTSSAQAAVRAVEARMAQGVQAQDLETLRALWAEPFMVNAPRNVVVPNRAAVLTVFRKGIPDYERFDPTIERMNVSGNTAVVMGRETVMPVEDAPHAGSTVKRRYTHVWKRIDGRWQLIARHAHITSIE